MRGGGRAGGAGIEAALEEAEVLSEEYRDHDAAAARERLARRLARPLAPRPPSPFVSDQERAGHELGLACTLVVRAPGAARSLARLMDTRHPEPAGALVFACLLHLAGRGEATRFWWQFAAGGGSRTAAYCLYLYHRGRAEFRDAGHWRAQARALDPPGGEAAGGDGGDRPLLPPRVSDDLLERCHRGKPPRLPVGLAEILDRLQAHGVDEYLGAIPRPSAHLAADLTNCPPRPDCPC
ncbi:hypothetical protein GCM10027168_48440 [Streptomyces capparidis]